MTHQDFITQNDRAARYKGLTDRIDHLTKMMEFINASIEENRSKKDERDKTYAGCISVSGRGIGSEELCYGSDSVQQRLREILYVDRAEFCKLREMI